MAEAFSPSTEPIQANSLSRSPGIPWEFLPLSVAFMTIAFAFGALARDAGMPWWGSLLMSLFVFAGTAQVVALSLMAAHQPIWMIVAVTALINARFLLLGTVLSPRVRDWGKWSRWWFATQITDESFALLFPRPTAFQSPRLSLWIQGGSHAAWVLGTVFGYALGGSVAQLEGMGLDFALVAMMLAVLVILVRDWNTILVAVCAGLAAIVAVKIGVAWLSILIAAAVGPAVGVWWEKRCHTRMS